MITAKQLSIGYKDALLSRMEFSIEKGRLVALLGRNGVGKTTLLKTLLGFLPALEGTITVNGQNLHELSNYEKAKLVSLVLTQREYIGEFSVFDLVALGRFPHTNWFGTLSDKDKKVVHEILQDVGLVELQDKSINAISDGEMQKTMLARSLAQDTPIVILDEPTSFLDVTNKHQVFRLLKKQTEESNKTILLSTHELDLALQYCDEILLLDKDNFYQKDSPDTLKASGLIENIFELKPN